MKKKKWTKEEFKEECNRMMEEFRSKIRFRVWRAKNIHLAKKRKDHAKPKR